MNKHFLFNFSYILNSSSTISPSKSKVIFTVHLIILKIPQCVFLSEQSAAHTPSNGSSSDDWQKKAGWAGVVYRMFVCLSLFYSCHTNIIILHTIAVCCCLEVTSKILASATLGVFASGLLSQFAVLIYEHWELQCHVRRQEEDRIQQRRVLSSSVGERQMAQTLKCTLYLVSLQTPSNPTYNILYPCPVQIIA